jgi:hypothetical protein
VARTQRWPPVSLGLLEKQLDQLVEAVKTPGDRSVDEQVWLTRFLVIRTCGYLEQVVHTTVTDHLWNTCGGTARSFALSWMNKSRNPSLDNLYRIIGRLDDKMLDELETLLESDNGALKEQISSLVGRRNGIAHGLNDGLSSRKALEMVEDAKQVASWFILNLEPSRR